MQQNRRNAKGDEYFCKAMYEGQTIFFKNYSGIFSTFSELPIGYF
jgi:hypothetical protein